MRFPNGKRPRPPGAGAQVPANPAAPARGLCDTPAPTPPAAPVRVPGEEHLGAACAHTAAGK